MLRNNQRVKTGLVGAIKLKTKGVAINFIIYVYKTVKANDYNLTPTILDTIVQKWHGKLGPLSLREVKFLTWMTFLTIYILETEQLETWCNTFNFDAERFINKAGVFKSRKILNFLKENNPINNENNPINLATVNPAFTVLINHENLPITKKVETRLHQIKYLNLGQLFIMSQIHLIPEEALTNKNFTPKNLKKILIYKRAVNKFFSSIKIPNSKMQTKLLFEVKNLFITKTEEHQDRLALAKHLKFMPFSTFQNFYNNFIKTCYDKKIFTKDSSIKMTGIEILQTILQFLEFEPWVLG